MKQRGTQLVCAILACFIMGWAHAQGDVEVPLARDLKAEAQAAKAKRLPILVLFMSPGCPYCEQVLQEFLLPMQRNAEYRSKVVMRQVDIGSDARLLDFAGHPTSHAQFATRHKIRLVPTIKLFDAQGHELAPPLVGLLTPDFYGGYLDQAIMEARAKLLNSARPGTPLIAGTN